MFRIKKVHIVLSIIFFLLLLYVTVASITDAISLSWIAWPTVDTETIDKVILFSWLIFSWGILTLAVIALNLYLKNKLKWLKVICLFVMTVLFLVFACIIKTEPFSNISGTAETIVLSEFSNYMLGFATCFVYFVITLIDNIFSLVNAKKVEVEDGKK